MYPEAKMPLAAANPAYHVALLWQEGLPQDIAEETAAWITTCSGPITVSVDGPAVSLLPVEDGSLAWDTVFAAVREERSRRKLPPTTFVYLLTHSPNELNWFAAEDENYMRS